MPPAITVSFFEKGRGLLWSGDIHPSKLEEKRLEAETNCETERAEAIEAAMAEALRLRPDRRWIDVAARVRVMR